MLLNHKSVVSLVLLTSIGSSVAKKGKKSGNGKGGKRDPGPSVVRVVDIKGKASHGVNWFNSETITDFAELTGLLYAQGDTCTAVADMWAGLVIPESTYLDDTPGAENGAPVTSDTPLDTLMATATGGFDNSKVPQNRPMYDNWFLAEVDEVARDNGEPMMRRRTLPTPEAGDANWKVTRRMQKDITVGEYNAANGDMVIECYDDGSSTVHIDYYSLPPKYPLTVWLCGVCASQECLDNDNLSRMLGGAPMYCAPLGPLPNAFVTDEYGSATYDAALSFCPLEAREDPPAFVSTAMHWDGGVYGGFFDTFGYDGFGAGVIASPICSFYLGDYMLLDGRGKVDPDMVDRYDTIEPFECVWQPPPMN